MNTSMKNYLKLKLFRRAKKIFRLLQPLFKKDTYILFDNLYEKNAECIDTWCVFQYMQRQGIRSYYVLWRENPFYEQLKKEKRLKNVLILKRSCKADMFNNYEFFFLTFFKLLRAKAVITSFGDLNQKITELLYKNKYITYIHTDHGSILLKTFMFKVNYFSPLKFNRFMICSDEEGDIFREFGWQKENLIKIGLPRWDLLKRKPLPQKNIFVMFTWRYSFGRWNKNFKTPLNQTQYYRGIVAFLQNEKLQKLLRENNIRLRYTLHHALLNQTKKPEELFIPNIEYVPGENISRYIGQADLFITDYSSLFFDFAFLHTPVVFYRPDFDDKTLHPYDREDMAHAKAMDKRLFNTCYSVDETLKAIEKYIQNGFELEKENCLKADALFTVKKDITKKFVNYLEAL